ncbi:hypothetical protein BJ912DRAFT_998308 [Pholiota molesta]|nr:hypothetical protein BJ912DRAFT_998308 [Pholiota molesta]
MFTLGSSFSLFSCFFLLGTQLLEATVVFIWDFHFHFHFYFTLTRQIICDAFYNKPHCFPFSSLSAGPHLLPLALAIQSCVPRIFVRACYRILLEPRTKTKGYPSKEVFGGLHAAHRSQAHI